MALYALRYEKHPSNALPILLGLLASTSSIPPHRIQFVSHILTYHHSLQTLPAASSGSGGGTFSDLFESSSIFSGARHRFRGLKGVENVYTQHSPRLEATLQNLIKGRLRDQQYPFIEGGTTTKEKPQDIIVFMIGGVTYEEAKMVAQVNASSPGIRVVLGGTSVHNSATFLEDVESAVGAWPEAPQSVSAAARLRREAGGR